MKNCQFLILRHKGKNGKRFNIEIQINDEGDYDKRALYYWAKLYAEQLEKSRRYSTLSKAIGIHILNFTSIVETNNYHNVFHITEAETGFRYFKDLELHTIELKKFSENSDANLTDIIAKVKNSLDMWVAFLTHDDLLAKDNLPSELDSPALKKALNVLDVMNFEADEREIYEGHLKWLSMEASALKKAEERGRAEGEARQSEGRVEGEVKKAHNIARTMLQKGMDIHIISEMTGLSVEEIISL